MRVTVSDVDAFRYWKSNDWMTEEMLHERLYRKAEPPIVVLLGRAVHKVLENTRSPYLVGVHEVEQDGYDFTLDFSRIDLAVTRGPKEVPTVRAYEFGDYEVELSGRVDAVDYDTVIDYKTMGKPPKYAFHEYFHEYFQWRAYLDMLGLDKFIYAILIVDNRRSKKEEGLYVFREAHNDIDFYSYPHLHDDVRRQIREFINYIGLKHPQLMNKYTDRYEQARS